MFNKAADCTRKLISLLVIAWALVSCGTSPQISNQASTTFIDQLKESMTALNFYDDKANVRTGRMYLDAYGIAPARSEGHTQYFYGVSNFENMSVVCHVFAPKEPVGTIFILHGYFDHTGSLSHVINAGLEAGYTVFSYDLPGHGLSGGREGDINGVSNNAKLLDAMLMKYEASLPKPYQLIGFSTGGTIALEHSLAVEDSPFESVVLVSPLLRHERWAWGKFAYTLFRAFINRIKRVDKHNSSNVEYLAFAKKDALRNTYLSFNFLRDIYQWNKGLGRRDHTVDNMLIVQGNLDTVVDWKYNLPVVEQMSKNVQTYFVDGGRHQLFNETKDIREKVFSRIFQFFDQNVPMRKSIQ